MAKTIPQLTDATTVNAADELIVQQGGVTKRATAAELMNTAPVTATSTTTARTLAARFADVVNVKDFGAAGNGSTDDSAAFTAAFATNKTVAVPQGTYLTNSAISGAKRFYTHGSTSFAGTNPLDTYPAFGPGVFKAYANGNTNCIIGIAHNTNPPATLGFPTGVTGYGKNDNAGNTAFGIYAEARQFANTGVVTNEIDSFNHGAAPSANLPPDRSIGTSQQHPVALTIASGGTADSSIGIHIAKEGSSPQRFLTGMYISPDACATYGVYIDCTSTSDALPCLIKHNNTRPGLRINGTQALSADAAWFVYSDGDGAERFSMKQDGRPRWPTTNTQATVGIAGAASVLPANPTGYLKVQIGNFTRVIPYYEP
jgi:hypothetical protein